MRGFGTVALLTCALSVLGVAPFAHAAPWTVSISGAGGRLFNTYYPTSRLGLAVDVSRAMSEVVELGLELGAWEEVGARGFTYLALGPTGPDREHDRDAAVSVLVRLGKRIGRARPHILLGAGEYLSAHRQTFRGESTWTSPEYSPGFSVGAGLSRSAMPTPLVTVRWHRVYAASLSTHGAVRQTTDRYLVSAGASFN